MGEKSMSMASQEAGAPMKAEHDGWNLQSNSAVRPTQEQLDKSLKDAVGDGSTTTTDETPEQKTAREAAEAEAARVAAGTTTTEDADAEPTEDEKKAAAAAEVAGDKKPVLPKAKKPSRADKLNDEIRGLTWQKGRITEQTQAAQGERDRIAAEIKDLQAKRDTLAAGGTVADATAAATAPKKALNPNPKPTWGGATGYEAQGKTFDDYESDKETWILEEARLTAEASSAHVLDTRDQTAREASQRAAVDDAEATISAQVEERVLAARQKYTPEVVDAALAFQLPIHEQMPGFRAVKDTLRTSDVGVELLLYFKDNPTESSRIASHGIFQALREMAWLEERVRTAQAGSVQTSERTVSSARPVINPVTGAAPHARDTRSPAEAEEAVPFGPDYLKATNRRLGMR